MTSHRQDSSSRGGSLRALYLLSRGVTRLTGLITIGAAFFYVLQQVTVYHAPLGYLLFSLCFILAIGGITGLCFMAVTKFIEIWAELIDSGRYKTQLLESLLTTSGDEPAVTTKEF